MLLLRKMQYNRLDHEEFLALLYSIKKKKRKTTKK